MKKRAKLCAALTCALLATALAAPGTRVLADEESSVESVVEETTETEETAAEEEGETEETDSSAEESIAEPASTDSGEETPAVSEADAEEAGESGESDAEVDSSDADALFEKLMACETLEEIEAVLDGVSNEEFDEMSDSQIEQVIALWVELAPVGPALEITSDGLEESVQDYETVNFSNVAPIKDSVLG